MLGQSAQHPLPLSTILCWVDQCSPHLLIQQRGIAPTLLLGGGGGGGKQTENVINLVWPIEKN
jgi:hypothetical protein